MGCVVVLLWYQCCCCSNHVGCEGGFLAEQPACVTQHGLTSYHMAVFLREGKHGFFPALVSWLREQ